MSCQGDTWDSKTLITLRANVRNEHGLSCFSARHQDAWIHQRRMQRHILRQALPALSPLDAFCTPKASTHPSCKQCALQ